MAEEITSVEMENALTSIFEKIDVVEVAQKELDTRIDGVESLARSAMSAAASAKNSITNIHTVPTNGHDVFLGVFSKCTKLAAVGILCWATVKCVQAWCKLAYEPPKTPYYNYRDTFGETYSEWKARQEREDDK